MSFDPITIIKSRTAVLSAENIDTDQIIPARFLKTTTQSGLGEAAFYDWRYDGEGRLKNNSPLAGVDTTRQQVLVAGANFGCGSSREHAPWALIDFGFKAIISSDIADIFKSNSLKNGLVPIEVEASLHTHLIQNPNIDVTIDVKEQTIIVDGYEATGVFCLEPFARNCLLNGVDQLGALLTKLPEIEAFEVERVACQK